MIGSGWLLGALNATKIAGPAAIISWVIGAGAVMLLALVIAELGSLRPVGGGNARYPHFAFGSLIGFGMGWIYWLGSVTLAPVETEAALQYATMYVNEWIGINLVHSSGGTDVLTAWGFVAAAILMLLFAILNLYGVSRLTKVNTAIVWWKIPIGSMVVGTVMYTLLQLVFLGGLNPASAKHGCENLAFANDAGPFAGIALGLGVGWLATLLYVSPAGTGLIYTGSSSRLTYGMGRNGYIPHFFDRLNDRGVPWISIIFSFGVGMIVLLPFPGWRKLVSFITSPSASSCSTSRTSPGRARSASRWSGDRASG